MGSTGSRCSTDSWSATSAGSRPLTVTVCAMSRKKGLARLLVPRGEHPIHAFGEEFVSAPDLARLVREARDMVSGTTSEREGT
jgi:hypothetical protein